MLKTTINMIRSFIGRFNNSFESLNSKDIEQSSEKPYLNTFRGKLIFYTLMASIVPLALFGILGIEVASAYLKKVAVEKHQTALDAVKSHSEVLFQIKRDSLRNLTFNPDIQALNQKSAGAVSEYLQSQSFFHEMYLFASNSAIITCEQKNGRRKIEEISRNTACTTIRKHCDRIIREKEISSIVIPNEGKSYFTIIFLIPVFEFTGKDEVRGLLAAVADFDSTDFLKILDSYSLNNDEYVCFFDEHGNILAKNGASLPGNVVKLQLPFDISELTDNPGSVKTINVKNMERNDLLSVSYSSEMAIYTGIGQPAEKVFLLSEKLVHLFKVTLLFSIVFSSALCFFLAGEISDPIQHLTLGIRNIQSGILTHRVPDLSEDEIGKAASELNSLAKSLERKNLVSEIWKKIASPGDQQLEKK
ncbi:MAG: cache and HAMP domain-containing protein [Candidatus Riflebacteria bacterium]|nr:cache and HAMP domain-containing protein [Candidatus Riflebacteria bacterium]